MSCWALIPAKGFRDAKSRLAPSLDARARTALARRMLEHVLDATARAATVDRVLVVTDAPEVERYATERGLDAVRDPPDARGLGVVVDAGLRALRTRGAGRAIVLMSDLPLATAEAIDTVVQALDRSDRVLVPDRAGLGTNALGLRLPPRPTASAAGAAERTCFGHPDSARRHRDAAARDGAVLETLALDALAFDVDLPADLEALDALQAPAHH
ncbi:MAG: 2-phospho-L-lactate guanylyltransferase [Myxococcales bacterium]|nr:2-phospho-L-lactate guanylyltransferase [Myxococcales bacterium]